MMSRIAPLFVPLFMLAVSESSVHAENFKAIHAATEADFKGWIDSLRKDKLRPDYVSVYGPADAPQFAAIAVEDEGNAWAARHHLSLQELRKELARRTADGFRLICV